MKIFLFIPLCFLLSSASNIPPFMPSSSSSYQKSIAIQKEQIIGLQTELLSERAQKDLLLFRISGLVFELEKQKKLNHVLLSQNALKSNKSDDQLRGLEFEIFSKDIQIGHYKNTIHVLSKQLMEMAAVRAPRDDGDGEQLQSAMDEYHSELMALRSPSSSMEEAHSRMMHKIGRTGSVLLRQSNRIQELQHRVDVFEANQRRGILKQKERGSVSKKKTKQGLKGESYKTDFQI